MPGTNSFYPYGESSTNILNNSEYQTDSERSSGAQSGAIARSKMYNKQARQAAAGAYAVGALVAKSGKNADDSSAATLAANFQGAVSYQAAHFVASAVSVSGTTATATVAELATTAAADLPALFALSLVLDQALPAGASIAITSSLPDVTLSWPIYVGSEALDSDTITGGAITLLIDTVGAKAFFKAGGGSKIPSDLPPLNPNFTLERSEDGTKIIAKADKLLASPETAMLAGGVWVLKSSLPHAPDDGTVKEWSRADLITTGKPFDGLLLGDVTASDAVNETILWLPENQSGETVLVPFIVLSVDYLGGVYVMRKYLSESIKATWGSSKYYPTSTLDSYIVNTYLNSILSKDIVDKLVMATVPVVPWQSSGQDDTMQRKAWSLSYGELYGGGVDNDPKMPYFEVGASHRIAYVDGGSTKGIWWTRSINRSGGIQTGTPYSVDVSGAMSNDSDGGASNYVRPAFVLPKDFQIQQRPDGSYTVYNDYGLMTLKDIKVSDSSSVTKIHVRENSGVYIFDYVSSNYNDSNRGCLFREEALAGTVGTSVTYPSGGAGQGASNWEAALPSSLRNLISEVTIKYKNATSVQETTARAFVPSIDEMYGTKTNYGTGTQWSMMKVSTNRVRYYNGSPISYWLRDAASSTTVNYMYTSGSYNSDGVNSQKYCVPAFTLPLTAPIRLLADGAYDLVPEDPALSAVTTYAAGDAVQLKDVPASTSGNKVIVKVPEKSGQDVSYIALRLGYGGVTNAYALMREDTLNEQVAFNSTPSPYGPQTPTAYENGTLDQYLTNTFKDALGVGVSDYLVDVPVQLGSASYTITRSIFAVSAYEIGSNVSGRPIEGTPFDYFSVVGNRGANNAYSSRTVVNTGATYFQFYVSTNGNGASISQSAVEYPRPIICLDADAYVIDNGDGTYTFAGSNPNETTVEWEVAWDADTPAYVRQYTYNQKGQYQTMLQGAVASTEDEPIPTFELPEFTGNHAIFGDETSGRIELYESGTLTLYPGTYDFFAVGAGSGSSMAPGTGSNSVGRAGGAGGYTNTLLSHVIEEKINLTAVIGAGGTVGVNGSSSSLSTASSQYLLTAEGGTANSSDYHNGGSGGSGGGAPTNSGTGGAGGSDGSNGANATNGTGGAGQGTTTRAFADPSGTLYSGGGGGASRLGSGGAGGAGGGGNGTNNAASGSGTPNTGGGAGGGYASNASQGGQGGSGIITIRWNNAA